MAQVKEVLRKLDLGNSVAEFDEALDQYFVETEPFRALVRGQADIVAGDKGTGKTAMFRILRDRYRSIKEMESVELITGFNPEGAPVFERLAASPALDEGQYITIWKAYLVALVGNWILEIYDGAFTDSMTELDRKLRMVDLRSADDKPTTIFNRLINLVRRITNPDGAEIAVTITPEGIPILTGKINLGPAAEGDRKEVPHREMLQLLDEVIAESGFEVWVVLDRLDEAFQAYPEVEVPALRALLRTYLDLAEFTHLHLKLFLRKDLFRRIIGAGFVNLTHVNARKIEIVWDDEDLLDLFGRRVRENPGFLEDVGLDPTATVGDLLQAIFPAKVDAGERKPTTENWILSRIGDGNGVKPPRNLIDLIQKSQEAQLRREDREQNEFEDGNPLIQADSIKRGLLALSEARVEDTLLAEAGATLADLVERFRDGKSEHNEQSLAQTLELADPELAAAVKSLLQIGFLEQVGSAYKVPMLYRDGLKITQGKAF